jgi:glycosyltransferase involved in cell wall biosynthesis
LLICFSHLRWNFVFQRPQHLLTRAARTYRVAVFEEPVFGDVEIPCLEVTEAAPSICALVPHLPDGMSERSVTIAQRALLDEYIAEAGQPEALWYYSPLAMAFSGHVPAPACVYDCMDELSGFKNAPASLPIMERRLLGRADLVFTGGMSLYEAKRHRHPSVHGFPSSVDRHHFAQARDPGRADPADQSDIPHPRLGFFGVIDERMDVDLVAAAADLRPDWHFVMLGPVVKIDEASLPRRPNLHWLGSKRYDELPAYIGGWDVGFMPFALNDATRFISPTKTPEFLAAGVPVVSTPIHDVVRPYGDNGLVAIAANAEELVAAAQSYMSGRPDGWQERVDRHLSTMSWDRTWRDMQRLVSGVIATKAAAGRAVARPLADAGSAHV